MSWPRPQTLWPALLPGAMRALLLGWIVLAALGLLASTASAQLLPGPEIPMAGVYTAWLERTRFEEEGWIRGMNHRHWLPPSLGPKFLTDYRRDELRVLPELGMVLWLRSPAILENFSVAQGGTIPSATACGARGPMFSNGK